MAICCNELCSNDFTPKSSLNVYCSETCRKKVSQERRLRSHGLSEGQANKLKMGKKCEICSRADKLVVDHDHASMAIRGVLCSDCNLGLGRFKDSISNLSNAIEYLKKTPSIEVPAKGRSLQGCGSAASWERGCRCAECVDAFKKVKKERSRARLQEGRFTHGTLDGYTLGCRCSVCKSASAQYVQKRATKNSGSNLNNQQ